MRRWHSLLMPWRSCCCGFGYELCPARPPTWGLDSKQMKDGRAVRLMPFLLCGCKRGVTALYNKKSGVSVVPNRVNPVLPRGGA